MARTRHFTITDTQTPACNFARAGVRLPLAGLLLAAIVGLLLATAMPARASSSNQWFYERQPIAKGKIVRVASSGEFTLSLKLPRQTAFRIACTASGVEAFWNTAQGGRDETRSLAFTCSRAECGRATATPHLPWTSTLLAEPEPPSIDEWEDVSLELTCGGTDYGTFTGNLEAKVGDVDPSQSTNGTDDLDDFVSFRGGLKKSLAGPNGELLWLTGAYHLGGKGHGVTDEG